MPKAKPLVNFKFSRAFQAEGRRGAKVTFTCGHCSHEASTKTLPGKAYDGHVFMAAVCPACGGLNAFADRFGNSVTWGQRRGASHHPVYTATGRRLKTFPPSVAEAPQVEVPPRAQVPGEEGEEAPTVDRGGATAMGMTFKGAEDAS